MNDEKHVMLDIDSDLIIVPILNSLGIHAVYRPYITPHINNILLQLIKYIMCQSVHVKSFINTCKINI